MSDKALLQFHLMPIRRETKRPLTLHGEKDASNITEVIRRWRQRFPDCNWAVACGPSGLIALDEDTYKPDYVPGRLESVVGVSELPVTAEWRSGKGGRVRLYRRPDGVHVKPGPLKNLGVPCVDVKASAGYVVCPPSVHPEGGAYEWVRRPEEVGIAEAPAELLELLTMEESGDGTYGEGLGAAGELFLKSGDGRWEMAQRFAGGLRRWGWSETSILGALTSFFEHQAEPDSSIAVEKLREVARHMGSLPVEEATGRLLCPSCEKAERKRAETVERETAVEESLMRALGVDVEGDRGG